MRARRSTCFLKGAAAFIQVLCRRAVWLSVFPWTQLRPDTRIWIGWIHGSRWEIEVLPEFRRRFSTSKVNAKGWPSKHDTRLSEPRRFRMRSLGNRKSEVLPGMCRSIDFRYRSLSHHFMVPTDETVVWSTLPTPYGMFPRPFSPQKKKHTINRSIIIRQQTKPSRTQGSERKRTFELASSRVTF